MRRRALALLALALLALVLPTGGALRAAAPGEDRAAIEAAITAQVEAFRRDDAARAYALAAPSVRALFPSPEIFVRMVRTAYAPVHRPRTLRFGALAVEAGSAVQRVVLQGQDGRTHLALYTMERQPDGLWLIAGVVLVTPPETGS